MSGGLFERFDDIDVRDLIAQFPLAWVCPTAGSAAACALLPMLGEYDAQGRLTHLFGHMSRANALVDLLSAEPRASFLFRGPQAYISPEHVGKRDWAPTWNYAQIRVEATAIFVPDETQASVERLTDRMEAGRSQPWNVAELGQRFDPMLKRIIAFRAEVTDVAGRFKLAQDEDVNTLHALLASTDDPAMVQWVRRFNKDRLT